MKLAQLDKSKKLEKIDRCKNVKELQNWSSVSNYFLKITDIKVRSYRKIMLATLEIS